MPGAGLCPGYTISRAILADATALTRGDRFLTVNFTRKSNICGIISAFNTCCEPAFDLTSWGFQDCQYDKNDGSYGGILGKLLYRTLPDYYTAGSTYAQFPFLVPGFIKDHLSKLPNSPASGYTWSRPPLPKGSIIASSYNDVVDIFANEKIFQGGYNMKIASVASGVPLHNHVVRHMLCILCFGLMHLV